MARDSDALTYELDQAFTQDGVSVLELSRRQPTLVVLLRHGGCPFCREALSDLREARPEIERGGTIIVLVHMMHDREAARLFASYGLEDLPRVSSRDRFLYRAFDLDRAGARRLFGWRNWGRGLFAMLRDGHGAGVVKGDPFQMPGVFLVYKGYVVKRFRHELVSDRPDYEEMGTCEIGLVGDGTNGTEATS
jgi:hypothetical protein